MYTYKNNILIHHPSYPPTGEGQNRLRRVLRAYARLDTDVGYCQGAFFWVCAFVRVNVNRPSDFIFGEGTEACVCVCVRCQPRCQRTTNQTQPPPNATHHTKKIKHNQHKSGMGFVAAMLLTYFPEEEAFHMLALVMRGPRPAAIRGIYLPGRYIDIIYRCIMNVSLLRVWYALYL